MDGKGKMHFTRYNDFMEGNTRYPNPWQYRIIAPYLTKGWVFLVEKTEGLIKFKNRSTFGTDSNIRVYNIAFILLQSLLHFLIFILYFKFLKLFIKSKWLRLVGMLFIFYITGNAIRDSYYPMDNYINIGFYLLTCFIIYRKIEDYWLPIICLIAALNRETAILIPLVFLLGRSNFSKSGKITVKRKDIMTVVISSVFFLISFFGIRFYYGELPPTDYYLSKSGFDMLQLNFLSKHSLKTYFEWMGTFSIFPLICIYFYKVMPKFLRYMLFVFIPIWFAAHLWLVVAWETRIYLVPMLIVFLPAALHVIEHKLRLFYQNEMNTN